MSHKPGPQQNVEETAKAASDEQNAGDAAASVQMDLDKLQEERDKFLDLLRRTQADFDNYQKRAAREAQAERKYAQRALALEILPALDNLDRFLSTVKEESELTKVVGMVQKQLVEGLARQGVKRIECVGKPFDPNQHEALMQQPSDKAVGTVLFEAEAGYMYNDRVLRPAKVIVAKSAE